MIFGSGDFYGELGATVFTLEERVDGFEQEGFCSGGGLGEFGVEKELTVKIDLASVERVGAAQRHAGTGDFEAEAGKIDRAVGHAEISGEAGYDIFDVGVFGAALAAAAERIDFFLHAWAGEVGVGHAELAVDGHALHDVAFPFPDFELGGDGGAAIHDGFVVFHGEIQQIFDARGGGDHIQGNGATFFGSQIGNFPIYDQRGAQEVGDDGLEDDVAVSAVDDRGVVGMEIYRVAADPQHKVGRFGGAGDVEKVERAAEFAG